MTQVFLVRHGQASAGTDDYDRLSTLGIQQAALLGEFWAAQNIKIDAAFCGTLKRQKHTAELVLKAQKNAPDLNVLPALDEYDHNAVDDLYAEGFTSDGGDLKFKDYVTIMKRWHDASKQTASASNATTESFTTFSTRGWQGVQETVKNADSGANYVFFTSGGIVSTILQQLLGLSFEQTMQFIWHTRNASITQLRIKASGSYLVEYNAVPHLLLEHKPELITQI